MEDKIICRRGNDKCPVDNLAIPQQRVTAQDKKESHQMCQMLQLVQGVFLNWHPPKKLKYGKPRLGESTLT